MSGKKLQELWSGLQLARRCADAAADPTHQGSNSAYPDDMRWWFRLVKILDPVLAMLQYGPLINRSLVRNLAAIQHRWFGQQSESFNPC
jgi:hypothetical protein